LMRAGRVEEANALAKRIRKDIAKRNKARFSTACRQTDAKDLWAAVRELTGRKQDVAVVDGVSAESLNNHYATISTDAVSTPPLRKSTLLSVSRAIYQNGESSRS